METEVLVKHAVESDAENFQTAFNHVMADKVAAAIENKYAQMFGAPAEEFDSDETPEEDYEQEGE